MKREDVVCYRSNMLGNGEQRRGHDDEFEKPIQHGKWDGRGNEAASKQGTSSEADNEHNTKVEAMKKADKIGFWEPGFSIFTVGVRKMIRHWICLCVAFILSAQSVSAFQNDAITLTVLATGATHVVSTRFDREQYPLIAAHRLLERRVRLSTNFTVIVDLPASLTAGGMIELRNSLLSVGLHDQRFYMRSPAGAYHRVILHDQKGDDLGAIVESEFLEETFRDTLAETDFYLPPSQKLKRFLVGSLILMFLPYWSGTADTIRFWIVVGVEVISLLIVVLWLLRGRVFRSNACWALPLALCTGVFVLLLFNMGVFFVRFGHLR